MMSVLLVLRRSRVVETMEMKTSVDAERDVLVMKEKKRKTVKC